MDHILAEIEHALRVQLYYLAVAKCLALPDICAAIESPDGETNGNRYRAWCATWLTGPTFQTLTASDMYRLRCGVLHQGIFGHPNMTFDRVVFSIPVMGNKSYGIVHNNIFSNNGGIVESVLELSSTIFCHEVIGSVRRWLNDKQNDPTVQENLSRLVRFRQNGIEPHIVGRPVIA